MDAIEFLKEYNRMCKVNKDCTECPLKGTDCSIGRELSEEEMINIVDKTEQWSKKHQPMTNAQKFEEVFDLSGYRLITQSADWWDEPYKEPKHE